MMLLFFWFRQTLPKLTVVVLAFVFFLTPSLREVVKWSPSINWFLLLYCIAFAVFLWLICSKYFWSLSRKRNLLNAVTYSVLAAWSVAALLLYPIADQRSQIGLGTTADDAMVATAISFFSGEGMYSPTLQGAAPISPGPAWIIINSPLAISGLIWMIVPLYGVLSIFACKHLGPPILCFAVLLMSSSLVFWNLMVVGHDLMAIGLGILGFTVFGYQISGRDKVPVSLWLAYTLLLGIFCTSRVLFLLLPFVIGFLFIGKGLREGWLVLVFSLLVAGVWHIAFYIGTDFYQPLHVLGRGYRAIGGLFFFIGALACCFSFLFLRAVAKRNILGWLLGVLLIFSVPLVFVAFGELVNDGWVFRRWEAANYLAVLSPVAAVTAALMMSGKGDLQR